MSTEPSVGAAASPQDSEPLLALDLLSVAGDEHPVAASWPRLPIELKQQIVDEVLEWSRKTDRRDELYATVAVGFFAQREVTRGAVFVYRKRSRAALARLQGVDRELRAICAPLLWKNVYATGSGAALGRLVDALPSQASHVRFLRGRGCRMPGRPDSDDKLEYTKVNQSLGRAVRMCDALEELHLVRPQHNPLIPARLPNLRIVTILSSRAPRGYRKKTYVPEQRAFLSALPSLTSLNVHADESDDFLDVGALLASLPNLKHLRLAGDAIEYERALRVGADEHASRLPPLESLELVHEGEFDLDVLRTFVTGFADTLTTLHLEFYDEDRFPDDDDDDEQEVPPDVEFALQRLTSLSIGTDRLAPFISLFACPATPLTFLRLDHVPGADRRLVDILALLRAHASTIKVLYVSDKALDGRDATYDVGLATSTCDALEACCASLGVEFRFPDFVDKIPDAEEKAAVEVSALAESCDRAT